ncbi:MAG: phytoene synthase [Rhodobacteraceae bacterium PARR1]|nr:MAG: phytoene synthase [Rhodobacteraceae bacterium PARR1]
MSLDACAALVERGDPDRFAALMAAPVAARGPLAVLYAYNLEIARAPWVTKEAMIAEMRLQWWRDIVAEAAAGKPARAHEVAGPLAALIAQGRVDTAVLDRMAEARRWDIYTDAFADEAALDAYLEDTAAGLTWASAQALGAGPGAEGAVRGYGWAMGLANFLRAVPELEDRGRIPLLDGRPDAVAALARRGLDRLAQARGRVPAPARPALIACHMAGPILTLVAREPQRVADGTVEPSEFARRWGLLRAAFGRV